MIRFLHTGDWHLGMRRHFLSDEAEPRYRQERLEAVRRLGEVARERGCSFIVAAGDLLDSNQVDPGTLARALEVLKDMPVPVYLLPGNHDPADAATPLRAPAHGPGHGGGLAHGAATAQSATIGTTVHILDEAGTLEVAPGVEIVAAPWKTRRPLTDLVADACRDLTPGPVRIVLGHGAVDVLSPDATDPALIRVADAEAAIEAGCVHYVALGDRHSVTSVGDSGRIWYAGSPEPTGFADSDAGRVLIVEIDGPTTIKVEPHTVGRWTFQRLEHVFAGDEDVDSLKDRLEAVPGKDRTVVRLSLEGTLSLHGNARLEKLLEDMGHVFAGLDTSVGRSEVAVLPADADFAALDVAGFARDALDELRAAALQTGDDSRTSQDALALMVRLTGMTT